jgi:glycine oxidase
MRDLLQGAIAILPELGALPLIEHWAGVRPLVGRGLPIIGASAVDGLVLAIGHYRNGVLLAPVTADLVAGTLCGSLTPAQGELIRPFLPPTSARLNENCGQTPQAVPS